MRLNPRVRASIATSIALASLLLGAALAACDDGTFPSALNVYDPDASRVTPTPDSSAPDAHTPTLDGGDASAANDSAASDGAAVDGSTTDAATETGAEPADGGDAGDAGAEPDAADGAG